MKTYPCRLAALLLLSACCLLAAHTALAATMAAQPWVTNRIAEAEARTDAKITAATNAIPAPVVDLTPATNYTDTVASEFESGARVAQEANYASSANSAYGAFYLYDDVQAGEIYPSDIMRGATNAAVAVADAKISTNNAAFVSAVLAVPLTGADAGDLAEIAEYGGYGTVGAALLALIAGLAALKRRMGTAETALAGKMPMYPMVAVSPSSGTLTVAPYTVATYTAGTSAAAFTVAVGTGTAGTARDCELVIDCTATGATAPTVTWPATFHPRTDAATDFACEAGVRNVYYISEYATGEFAVGGWQETAGGNGT